MAGHNFISSKCTPDSSLHQIRKWLDNCLQNHPSCSAENESESWVPTRLIEIKPGVSDGTPITRLCLNPNLLGQKYMTLSHCWGPNPAMVGLITTIDNIRRLEESIPWDKLSKTFQDAIILTLKLGINYLWIDSLCIIQQCPEDWIREAKEMQRVYYNSFLNIAATAAEDGRRGCFFDRLSRFMEPLAISLTIEQGSEPETLFPFIEDPPLECGLARQPLIRRCWVMQERILAPRVLHFTDEQLIWECNERQSFEAGFCCTGHILVKLHFKLDAPRRSLRGIQGSSSFADYFDSSDEDEEMPLPYDPRGFQAWSEIVHDYSAASLTNFSDKLVALNGVAERMKIQLNDEYFWGLWRNQLTESLLWKVTRPENAIPPQEHIAPTWSWASINGSSITPMPMT